MGNLILNSLEVRRFRGFQHLQIDHLEQVNLIVGKNNIGKSSLLEALRLYADRGNTTVIWEVLEDRDEYADLDSSHIAEMDRMLTSLKYLFYGREDITIHSEPICIGPVNAPNDTMTLGVGWYAFQENGDVRRKIQLKQLEEYNGIDSFENRFYMRLGTKYDRDYPFKNRGLSLIKDPSKINSVFIKANGLTDRQLDELWANVALTSLEKEIFSALRIVAPGVEDLNILGDAASVRTIFVKVASINKRIPLRSLGNGMLRTLGIVLALANAKNGFLLIDEIENGLHYSIQPDLWHLIFRMAQHLNVQVFATTHSWDCIKAFQEVASEGNQEGMLIRLQNRKDEISAVVYDEEELKIATHGQIEVR